VHVTSDEQIALTDPDARAMATSSNHRSVVIGKHRPQGLSR